MAFDLKYLKKRAEMTRDFYDDKVLAALLKIVPPCIVLPDAGVPDNNVFECEIPNKMIRNWIDLIPESDRGFIRFTYVDGGDMEIEKYIKLAMTTLAWKNFQSLASKDAGDSDLFLMRWIIWHGIVLREPVGVDFGNYEMNMIFGALPIDIANNKIKMDAPSFSDFYRQIAFVRWGLKNAG